MVLILSVPDAAEREKLNEMETNFNLEDEEIDQLIAAGRQVLRDSPQFQEFVAHNKQVPVTQ